MIDRREPLAVLINAASEGRIGEIADSLRTAGFRVVEHGNTHGTEVQRGLTPHVVIQVAGADPAACATAHRENRRRWPYVETVVIGGAAVEQSELTSEDSPFCRLPHEAPPELIVRMVSRAGRLASMRRELIALRQSSAMSFGFDNFIGVSDTMVRARETAQRVASTDIAVLLRGPAGCGKRHLATVMHYHSLRQREPFITIDFDSVPAEQHGALLFGVENDSQPGRPGLLERADGGTLYLADVEAMSEEAQTKLWEFVQNHTVAGAESGEPKRIDVRFISATGSRLSGAVEAGSFRADLQQALDVITIDLPPLSGRAADIEVLTSYILHRLTTGNGQQSVQISREALEALADHGWPGNIRELENTLRRAIALCCDRYIEREDIIFLGSDNTEGHPAPTPTKVTLTIKGGLLDSTQRTLIVKALDANNWNYSRTAANLGIGRTTLWRKIRKYDLRREKQD
ncbi:sigma 54-interacting transcriptional regulator [bacterium]|nr:sigma 54-interacting transcriptional regulator [bacterium]